MRADKALLALERDLISAILGNADDLGACAEQITVQVREIIGAKIVALFEAGADTGYDLVGICPARQRAAAQRPEMSALLEACARNPEACFAKPGEGEIGVLLAAAGRGSSYLIPLRDGRGLVGYLVLLDLMDEAGIEDVLSILKELSGLLAILLRNSFLYRNMEALVEERSRALRESEQRLVQAQKLEAIGRLAGGVAHDFNNKLQVISGFAEIALSEAQAGTTLHDCVRKIAGAAEGAARLTRQLLAFARKQAISPEHLELGTVVQKLLDLLSRLIGEHISLEHKSSAEPANVCMDHGQIDQILTNLCVNARDAIVGTGWIRIRTGRRTISREDCAAQPLWKAGTYAYLEVADSGSGMDEETMSHIFEPFFTTKAMGNAKANATGTGSGTGLGLATVFGIASQNDGFISVQSAAGRGSTFTVYLPLDQAAGAEAAERTAIAQTTYSSRGATVLLVEDESSILEYASILLEAMGARVLVAHGPEEALGLARENPGVIDLLITDVLMPGMNGHDLALAVTALEPGAAVIFMSGYTDDVLEDRLCEFGEQARFIEKPFNRNAFEKAVGECLARKG